MTGPTGPKKQAAACGRCAPHCTRGCGLVRARGTALARRSVLAVDFLVLVAGKRQSEAWFKLRARRGHVVPAHEMTGPAGPISSSNRSNWSLDGLFVWHLKPGSVQLVQRTGRLVVWFGHCDQPLAKAAGCSRNL